MSARHLIEAAAKDRGSEAKLATACGVSQAAINKAKKADRCSPRLALKIERVAGISRHLLCPEIFGPTPALIAADASSSQPEALAS